MKPGAGTLFSKLSIRARLLAMLVGVALFVIGAGTLAIIWHDTKQLQRQLLDETRAATRVLAQDFARVILLDTADAAADVVAKLEAFSAVRRVDLHDRSGKHRLQYLRAPQDDRPLPLAPGEPHRFADDRLLTRFDVVVEGSRLGEAVFVVSTEKLETRIHELYASLVYFVPAMTLVAVLLALWLQRYFSGPLGTLSRAVRAVSERRDYGLRLPVRDGGEFGQLVEGFNAMLEQIERATRELSGQTERLQVTLESIGDGVITTDTQGRIEYLNPAAERICGWTTTAARGRPIDAVLQLRDSRNRRQLQSPVHQALRQRELAALPQDADLLQRDGGTVAVQSSAAPIRDRHDRLIGAITVFKDVSQARAMADALTYQATHDALTGLENRAAFDKRLRQNVENARSFGERHALLYLDLDQFKVVNDSCGHAAGDELLKQLAQLFKTTLRAGDCLARLGGDEFGLILMHCPLDRARLIADELLALVGGFRFHWQGQVFNVGLSIGLTEITPASGDVAAILSNADAACYEAKDAGRNCVYVYRDNDQALAMRRNQVAQVTKIRSALDEDRLVLFAQDIADAQGRDQGLHYEVLVRLRERDGRLLAPGEFLPAAERFDLIEQIDRWVLTALLEFLANDRQHLARLFRCSVNLSAVSLRRGEFLAFAEQQLRRHPELGRKLTFEITETAAIGNLADAEAFIGALHQYGVRFALDDFGTGMSSLAYLKRLPVDYVKIDGQFVRDILEDPIDRALVQSITAIAHVTAKQTVAEVVEDAETLQCLRELGVDYVQGYHIGRPRPLLELASDAPIQAAS
ncbi:MAG: hypothetical protein RLZ44_1315 [Pseudomonadota bacterium]|jgi:diguanylate cyclase (GGDEF)-like protein/PAS domain S-box-containing protein